MVPTVRSLYVILAESTVLKLEFLHLSTVRFQPLRPHLRPQS
jgi:hypothetical protein